MIKVCHVTSAHSRYDGRIFQKECTSLAKHGYEVYLLVGDDKKNETINVVNIVSTKFKPKNRKERFFKSGKYIKQKAIEIDADIYHFHDPDLLKLAMYMKKMGKTVIFDSHEYYFEQIKEKPYLNKYIAKIVAQLYRWYETYVCKKIDAVIFPCSVKGVNVFNNRAKKVVYINNTPIINNDSNKGKPYLERKNIACCMGGLSYARGISYAIEACYQANIKFVIAGIFQPSSFGDEVKSKPSYSSVEYLGQIDKSKIKEVLGISKIGISNLLDIGQYHSADNLPTKVYEFMQEGIPTIIHRNDYTEMVNSKYNCFITVKPNDVEEIKKAIEYLIKNPNIAQMMGENGKKAIDKELNWNNEEEKLIELYSELIKIESA